VLSDDGRKLTGNNIKIGIWDNFDNDRNGDQCDGVTDYECNSHGNNVHSIIWALAPDADVTRFQNQALPPGGNTSSDGRYGGHNTDIMNVSLGFISNNDLDNEVTTGWYEDDWQYVLDRNDKDTMIAVVSAGNGSTTTWGGSPAECTEGQLNGCNTLAAGAINTDGISTVVVGALNDEGTDLANYSTTAGELKEHYIVAPVNDRGLSSEDGGDGTSFSAPVVTGTLALILDKWDSYNGTGGSITHEEAVEIVLKTADDMGEVGVDATYGNGRLNVGAALSPYGRFE